MRAKRAGFTLVEILIVIGITAVLSSMVLTYTSASRDQVALYVEQAKLAQTISRAKSLAITTYNDPNGEEDSIPCGYGVHFDYDAGEYLLFSYDAANCTITSTLDPQAMTVISTAELSIAMHFSEDAEDPIQDILFIPPDPKTWIWQLSALTTSTSGRVYLETAKGAASVAVSQG